MGVFILKTCNTQIVVMTTINAAVIRLSANYYTTALTHNTVNEKNCKTNTATCIELPRESLVNRGRISGGSYDHKCFYELDIYYYCEGYLLHFNQN